VEHSWKRSNSLAICKAAAFFFSCSRSKTTGMFLINEISL
jgi:hypothetical protein